MPLKKFNIFSSLIFILFLTMVGRFSSEIYAKRKEAFSDLSRNQEKEVLISYQGARLLSFGNIESWTDFRWIEFLQLESLPAFYRFYLLDMVTELDPSYYEAAIFGSSYLSVVDENFQGAKKILEKTNEYRKKFPGETNYPHAWAIPMTLGYVYLFDLQDIQGARRVYREALVEPGAPDYLKYFVKRFETVEGRIELGYRVLALLDIQAKTRPELKKTVDQKRTGLKLFQFFYHANRDYQKYLKFHSKKPSKGSLDSFLSVQPEYRADPLNRSVFLSAEKKLTSQSRFIVPFKIGEEF